MKPSWSPFLWCNFFWGGHLFCSHFHANESFTKMMFILACKWTSHHNSVHSSMQMNLSQQFCSFYYVNEPLTTNPFILQANELLMTIMFILLCKWTFHNNCVHFFIQMNPSWQFCSSFYANEPLITTILFNFFHASEFFTTNLFKCPCK